MAEATIEITPKMRAATAALEEIRDGQIVGLGSGSTAELFIAVLGQAVAAGRFKSIRGVPTSVKSETLARSLGIALLTFAEVDHIDVTIDGADEIDAGLRLIKGLGGALLREKLVAQNSRRMVVIADDSKVVDKLGVKTALPVEVVPFGHEATERFLRSLGCRPVLRGGEKPYVTDNHNFIYDCHFAGIDDPTKLELSLKTRAGVVETGLFINIAHAAIVGDEQGVAFSGTPSTSLESESRA